MALTQYYTATSIDGYIADQDNSLDWLFEADADDEADKADPFSQFFDQVGAFALGATTYQWILDHHKPEEWQRFYGTTPAWVFTHRTLPELPGAVLHFVQGDVAPVHEAMLAAAGGKNVWLVGGGELVGQFADRGLLDEIIVAVAPVTLGGGAPLLPRRLTSRDLTLVEAKQAGPFAKLRYRLGRAG